MSLETSEERGARLQRMRDYQVTLQTSTCQESAQVPQFDQQAVRSKMPHSDTAAVDCAKCSTYLEGFPGMKLQSDGTECLHCSMDKHIPKRYSSVNNITMPSILLET